jgi:hypothetical protein
MLQAKDNVESLIAAEWPMILSNQHADPIVQTV